MSMEGLKPCPFCGGRAERVYKSNGQTTHIECTGCKAQFPKSTMSNRYDEAWNARGSADRVTELERLARALYRAVEVLQLRKAVVDKSFVAQWRERLESHGVEVE